MHNDDYPCPNIPALNEGAMILQAITDMRDDMNRRFDDVNRHLDNITQRQDQLEQKQGTL